MKQLDPRWYEDPRTFSFVHIRHVRDQEAVFVVQSKTFNVSPRLDNNKYVLCAFDVEYHYFILLFDNETNARNFHDAVKHDLEGDINCSSDWLTRDPELLAVIS